MKNRIVSLLLALLLILGIFPAAALRANAASPANVYAYLKTYAMSGEHNSDKTVYTRLFYTDEYEEAYFVVEYYTSGGSLTIRNQGRNYSVSLVLKADMSLPYTVSASTEYGHGDGTLKNPGSYTEQTQLTLDYFVGYDLNQAEDAEKVLTRYFPDLLEYLLLVIDGGGYTLKDLRFSKFTRHTVNIDRQQAVVTPPTCSEPGSARFVCKLCGRQIIKELPPTGLHSWAPKDLIYEGASFHESYASYVCTVCGATKEARLCAGEVFTDMPAEGNWAHKPIDWAYFSGVTSGKTATSFEPKTKITRAEAMTFLWTAAGKPTSTLSESPFTDVTAGKYYYKPVLWAVEHHITTGKTATTFAPKAQCSRAEIMTFLWNALGKPEPTLTESPFTDVTAGKYYYKAVLWAVENNVTGGTTQTTFSPKAICTRAQVVTFLYKLRDQLHSVPGAS